MSEPSHGAAALFDDVAAPTAPVVPGQHRRRRRRWPFVLGSLVVLALAVGGGAWFTVRKAVANYDHNIERFADPFPQLPADQRPASTAQTGTLNVLLLGSDSRISAGDPSQWSAGAHRPPPTTPPPPPAHRTPPPAASLPPPT